jgi:WD40 repeat protein/serine/threonine protein kinase
MKTEAWRGGIEAAAEATQTRSLRPQDNPLVVRALEEYLAVLEAGRAPDRSDFLSRHADIANALAECLDGLDFIRAAASRVREASRDGVTSAADAAPIQAEAPLGDYRIVREVGRGGMGVVYEATQISLGRRVALKVLPFAAALDGRQLQRFKNEAQAAANLHHQHIVPVYAVGCERGVHFYAMQFIEGRTLAAVIDELRGKTHRAGLVSDVQATGPYLPTTRIPVISKEETAPLLGVRSTESPTTDPSFARAAVTLAVQAADALEFAHEFGIVHRDIKPANLLVDGRGQIWVTDFGLAQVQGDAKLTMSGDLLGTLRYMSPEQALAQRVHLDHRTDIYSLGVTLYELLTLEPAFGGRDRQELLRQIAFEEPQQPRKLNRAIPSELETIVLKAIAKNPAERYPTARDLADDLRRFLEDKPIRARRPTLTQRARKWARRHQPIVWAAGVVVALSLIGATVGALLLKQAATEKAATEESSRKKLELQHYYQTLALAERHHSAGSLGLAERLLDSASCPVNLRGWEWHYLKGLCRGTSPLLKTESILFSLALSANGNLLAAGGNDGSITIWDTQTWRPLVIHAHNGRVSGLAFSADGKRLWSGGDDGAANQWDTSTGARLASCRGGWSHSENINGLALSPDNQFLVLAGDSQVRILDAQTGRLVVELVQPQEETNAPVAFSPDGRFLITGCGDKELNIWNTSSWQRQMKLQGHGGAMIEQAVFSPDGRLLASASRRVWDDSDANDVIIWDLENRSPLHILRGLGGGACSVAFSPDGLRLATGGCEDPTIRIWDVQTGQETLTLRGHKETIFGLAFSPNGHRLYSAGADHMVRVWDGTPAENRVGPELQVLRGHEGRINSVAFTHDSRSLVSGGMDRTVRLWDITTGRELRTLIHGPSPVYAVAFSPDGAVLATGSFCAFQGPPERPELRIWDARSWREQLCLPWPNEEGGGLTNLAFSPDSRRLLVTTNYHPTVLDVTSGLPLLNLCGSKNLVRAVAFGSKGQIAWGGLDGELMLWQESLANYLQPPANSLLPGDLWPKLVSAWATAQVRPSFILPAHESRAVGVAFAPDESRLASCGIDGIIKVWAGDGTVWTLQHKLEGHRGPVHSVAFSPDGRRLASAGQDGTVRIWDVATGQQVRELRGHTDCAYCVSYSPDGHYLASGSSDGTIRIWDAHGVDGQQPHVATTRLESPQLSSKLVYEEQPITRKSKGGR